MTRKIYLAVFSNKAKPAHWAIWFPTGGQGQIGKTIHVTGNPAIGFFLEFKRNYNLQETRTPHQTIPLGEVEDRFVAEIPATLPSTRDTIARDRLESTAITVPPPERSPNPFDSANWIFDFVEKLITDNFIDASARAVLQSAPKRM